MTEPLQRPEWGGAPVTISGGAERVRPVGPISRPVYGAALGGPSFAVADLLRRRGPDQRRAVTALLNAGLSPTAGRVVLVGSLFGGVGTSTVAAQLRQTWAGFGADSVMLDSTGHLLPGLTSRIDPNALAGVPSWGDFGDFLAAPKQAEGDLAAAHAAAPGLSVLVSSAGPAPLPPTVAQVEGLAWTASRSWPLVIIDGGSDHQRLMALGAAVEPGLLLMVCRPDLTEIRATAGFLRVLHRSGDLDCQQHAVIVCVEDRRNMAKVSQTTAAATDAAAGSVVVEFRRELHSRATLITAGRRAPDLDLLAATVAAASAHEKGDRKMNFLLSGLLMAPGDPTPAPTPGGNLLPKINPDMNAPGMTALLGFSDYLAAYALWACAAAVLIGIVMVVIGPRLGFHAAKALGMGGIIGGIILAGILALATDAVNLTYLKFGGGA